MRSAERTSGGQGNVEGACGTALWDIRERFKCRFTNSEEANSAIRKVLERQRARLSPQKTHTRFAFVRSLRLIKNGAVNAAMNPRAGPSWFWSLYKPTTVPMMRTKATRISMLAATLLLRLVIV
jgi:hypothetical protein